MKIRLYL